MDVLTDVLSSVHFKGQVFCRSELTAPWGVSTPSLGLATFHVVDRGSCLLRIEGEDEIVPLAAGDLVVFPTGKAHDLMDTPDSPLKPLAEIAQMRCAESMCLDYGGGGVPTTLVCGAFIIANGGHPLLSMLPPMIHVKGDQGRAVEWLDTTLKFLASEAASTQPGAETIVARLTEILFVQAVRSWIKSEGAESKGWITALTDPQIGESLRVMHQEPAEPWTVGALAETVGMSRTSFSNRFGSLVGDSPLQYLTKWRMQVASNLLSESDLSMADIADQVGYQSEIPFNRAFKREVGTAPGAYRRQSRERSAPLSPQEMLALTA